MRRLGRRSFRWSSGHGPFPSNLFASRPSSHGLWSSHALACFPPLWEGTTPPSKYFNRIGRTKWIESRHKSFTIVEGKAWPPFSPNLRSPQSSAGLKHPSCCIKAEAQKKPKGHFNTFRNLCAEWQRNSMSDSSFIVQESPLSLSRAFRPSAPLHWADAPAKVPIRGFSSITVPKSPPLYMGGFGPINRVFSMAHLCGRGVEITFCLRRTTLVPFRQTWNVLLPQNIECVQNFVLANSDSQDYFSWCGSKSQHIQAHRFLPPKLLGRAALMPTEVATQNEKNTQKRDEKGWKGMKRDEWSKNAQA